MITRITNFNQNSTMRNRTQISMGNGIATAEQLAKMAVKGENVSNIASEARNFLTAQKKELVEKEIFYHKDSKIMSLVRQYRAKDVIEKEITYDKNGKITQEMLHGAEGNPEIRISKGYSSLGDIESETFEDLNDKKAHVKIRYYKQNRPTDNPCAVFCYENGSLAQQFEKKHPKLYNIVNTRLQKILGQ